MVLLTWMNEKTRTCWPGVAEIARRAGSDPATIRRHLRKLEALKVIVTTQRRKSCRSNLTSVYFFPLLNEEFLRSNLRGGYRQNARVIQIPEIKEQTTTPREDRAVEKPVWKPDRETYRERPARCHQPFGSKLTFWQAWKLQQQEKKDRLRAEILVGSASDRSRDESDARHSRDLEALLVKWGYRKGESQ
jgi:hypothetical protein